VWEDAEKALSEVRGHLEALRREFPIAEESTVLGGFSRGGGLAVAFALRRAIPAHRFVVLEPYLRGRLPVEEPDTVAGTSLPQLRGYIFAGENDTLGLAMAGTIADAARARGATCEVEVLPGLEHAYPPDFVSHPARGLAHVMASRR
jgi:predicted esterase